MGYKMPNTLRNEAVASYHSINNQWLKFHYRMLQLCVLVSAFFEVIMYFIFHLTNALLDPDWLYWIKYIIIPIIFGSGLIVLARYTIQKKNFSISKKEYIMSFLFMMVAFNLSFMHSGYIAILFVAVIPILMTVIYENRRLTSTVAMISMILQIANACNMLWDPHKIITHEYLINLVIIVISTGVSWTVSFAMIRFARMKKEIIIQQNVERKLLKQRIHQDELTKVGSREAMLMHLENIKKDKNSCHYIAMMDIDDFKQINDQAGHLFGDEVLRCFGSCLGNMGDNCFSYRYGGDEFCVIFKESKAECVLQAIRWLQSDFRRSLNQQCYREDITFSAGFAKYGVGENITETLRYADEALYESKKRNHDSITQYQS